MTPPTMTDDDGDLGPLPADWELELAPPPPRVAPRPLPQPAPLAPVIPIRPPAAPHVRPFIGVEPRPRRPRRASPSLPTRAVAPRPRPRPRAPLQPPPALVTSVPAPRPRRLSLSTRARRRQVVDLAGGAAVQDRGRLWLPVTWPAMPAPGTDTALAHWLRALGATAGTERVWITAAGTAVLAAAPRTAAITLAALAGEGVHLTGSDAAAALAAALDATPHSLPAPGVLVGGDLLVTAAVVLEPEARSGAPTPADPGQRVEAALDAANSLSVAAPSLLPLLAFAPPRVQFVVASATRIVADNLDDATPATRASLAAATLDDQLVALGLRPSRPAPRQLAAIATIVAATLAIGDSLDREVP